MSDLLIKNLELPKEDRIQLSIYPNGKVINHSSFTDTTLLLIELPPHGTQSDWHTGTPTEEGWYLVLWRDTIDDCEQFTALMWNNSNKTWYDVFTTDCNWVDEYRAEVIAWKKIEPYKED